MKLTEERLRDLSKIEVRYLTGPASKSVCVKILVVKYSGSFGHGSGGDNDGRFMRAMAKAGVSAFKPWGLIHDLSDLNYQWGDMLETVFIGPDYVSSPSAIVVGPKCEEAVRTLLLGMTSPEPLEKLGNVFRRLEDAWDYVDSRIE